MKNQASNFRQRSRHKMNRCFQIVICLKRAKTKMIKVMMLKSPNRMRNKRQKRNRRELINLREIKTWQVIQKIMLILIQEKVLKKIRCLQVTYKIYQYDRTKYQTSSLSFRLTTSLSMICLNITLMRNSKTPRLKIEVRLLLIRCSQEISNSRLLSLQQKSKIT